MATTPPRRRRRRRHYRLVVTDRVLATLVVLRFHLVPHHALAVGYQVDRATITRAVNAVRPLLAASGFAVPGQPGVRLRTLADVVADAAAEGIELRIDGTETQVRRPRANRCGRRAFVSGKRKQHTSRPPPSATATVGPCGSGRCAQVGCTTRPRSRPKASRSCSASTRPSPPRSIAATRAWPRGVGGQVHAPPRPPPKDAHAAVVGADLRRACQRRAQAVATLQRYLGRRESYAETHLAIAGLVSDRAARR